MSRTAPTARFLFNYTFKIRFNKRKPQIMHKLFNRALKIMRHGHAQKGHIINCKLFKSGLHIVFDLHIIAVKLKGKLAHMRSFNRPYPKLECAVALPCGL